jgi:hypothetical protein
MPSVLPLTSSNYLDWTSQELQSLFESREFLQAVSCETITSLQGRK